MSFLFILLAPQLHYLTKQILDFQVVFNKWEQQKIFLGVPKALKMFAEAKFSPFPTSKGYGVYPGRSVQISRRSQLGITGRTMQKCSDFPSLVLCLWQGMMLKSQLRPKSPGMCCSLVGADGAMPRSRLEDHIIGFIFCSHQPGAVASQAVKWRTRGFAVATPPMVGEMYLVAVQRPSGLGIHPWGYLCKPWSLSPSSLQDTGLM